MFALLDDLHLSFECAASGVGLPNNRINEY